MAPARIRGKCGGCPSQKFSGSGSRRSVVGPATLSRPSNPSPSGRCWTNCRTASPARPDASRGVTPGNRRRRPVRDGRPPAPRGDECGRPPTIRAPPRLGGVDGERPPVPPGSGQRTDRSSGGGSVNVQRYLSAKRTVDDRALGRRVEDRLGDRFLDESSNSGAGRRLLSASLEAGLAATRPDRRRGTGLLRPPTRSAKQ